MKQRPYKHLAHVASFDATPLVFFTVVSFKRRAILATDAVHDILRGIWLQAGERNGWWVGDYIIMPDHLHFFARPCRTAERMRDWIKMWKSLSARRIAEYLGIEPPVWQEEYFDRYLRSSENYTDTWRYVEANALKAQLVARAEDWPYRGRINTLMF